MKIITVLILIMSLCLNKTYAHNSKEAFFVIKQKNNLVEIKAEFPWKLRNAVFAFKPTLENSKDEDAFEDAFFEYVKLTIILKNRNGGQLKLIDVKEVKKIGHSHQSNFIFMFRGNDLVEVKNEIMFNISNQQTNYHTILVEGTRKEFITSINKPEFNLQEKGNNNRWLVLIFILPLLYFIIKKRMNITANKG